MSNENNSKCLNDKISLAWDKYVYTGIVFLTHMAFGLGINSFGPAFVDFKYILNTSMSLVSLISSFVTFGFIIGSLFGFLYKYLNRQITLIVFLTLMGITTALMPYSPNLWSLYLCVCIYGLGSGAWTNASNVWLIEIWDQKSAPFLQLSNFMYGIGSILGPLIDKPYLTGEKDVIFNGTDISNSTEAMMTSLDDIDRRSRLKTPFLINGIIQMIGPILMSIMFLIKRYKFESKTSEENPNSSSTKLFDGKESPRVFMIILMSIFLAFYCVSENTYLQFGATYYQYIELKFTASKSAEIVSAMALSYTIGRGISVFIAIKVKPKFMIAYQLLIIFIAIGILLFGQNSITLIWIGSLTLSFGFSSTWSAIYAFIGQYIEVTNKIGTILTFFSGSLNMSNPFILGTFIEKHSIIYLLSISFYLLVAIFIFCIILYTIKKTLNNINAKNQLKEKFYTIFNG